MTKSSLTQFLKHVADVCVAKKRDPFAALMGIAQDQHGFFTTKQAIEAGYADNTHLCHVRAGELGADLAWLLSGAPLTVAGARR